MEEVKISDIYDPMELANDLVLFRSQYIDDPVILNIYENSKELSEDIMKGVGNDPQANRGVAILASTLMTVISDSREYSDSEEDHKEFYYRFCTVGLPSLLLNLLTHENIVNAKNVLEGVLEI